MTRTSEREIPRLTADNVHPPSNRGLLLVNVGTPDAPTPQAVRRYLAEFLSDPLVIQLPKFMRPFQRLLGRYIAVTRAASSAKKYGLVWTELGSPLRVIMEEQAAAVRSRLPDWQVFIAMRYGTPSIEQALREMAAAGVTELVVLPVYPQFSQTTTGTVVQEVYRVLRASGLHLNVRTHTTWFNDAGYVNAQAHLIADYAKQHRLTPDNSLLLFSAHGLPVSYVERGDPYQRQLLESVRLIGERLGWPADRYRVAYQSRVGRQQWLTPELLGTLRELAAADERRVLVCPISFVVDCLETLEELHIGAREVFNAAGGDLWICPALNTYERFIDTVRNLTLRGPQPIGSWKRGHTPLFDVSPVQETPADDCGLDRLVMLGVTLKNRIGGGAGPPLNYTDEAGLSCVKRPHHETQLVLEQLKARGLVAEAFIWNTCFRFECYAWLPKHVTKQDSACIVDDLRRTLFATTSEETPTNLLFGANAWHHLMRTISGLNSGLPGDKDIVDQFLTAFQLAENARSAGPHARALSQHATDIAARVRTETGWGRLDPGYCYAALQQIEGQLPLRLANARHVVIGGSTTSRSILETLYDQFGVKEPSVTFVYRTHQGGNMKLLRKAVRHGRRLRVQRYDDPAVLAAITDADVLFFGIDRDEPVLTAEMLQRLRDFNERPLVIIDFNTAGSTAGVAELQGVTLWDATGLETAVQAHADEMCRSHEFPDILQEAEQWISTQAPEPTPPGFELPCVIENDAGQPTCSRCGQRAVDALVKARNSA
jgi:protoporphyrin/coproporphyrin ferrochelatase